MKKRVLILFVGENKSKPEKSPLYIVEDLQKKSPDLKIYYSFYKDLVLQIHQNKASIYDANNKKDIKSFDLVIFRFWVGAPEIATSCALYLNKHDIPFFDTEVFNFRARSKVAEYFKLWFDGISVPDTLVATKHLVSSVQDSKHLKFPLVVKSWEGSRGRDNHLVKNISELKKVITSKPDEKWIVQNFIQNEGDYRIVIFGRQVRTVIHRIQSDNTSHVNNSSQGARVNLVRPDSLPKNILKDAISAAISINRQIAGVDVILDANTGKHYILEVNYAPQINTGAFIEDKTQAFASFLKEAVSSKYRAGLKEHIPAKLRVDFPKLKLKNVKAKVDTGAYYSVLHVSKIELIQTYQGKPILCFYPLDESHQNFVMKPVRTQEYETIEVYNSFGQKQSRYLVWLNVKINGKTIKTRFSLTDRSGMPRPVLLGRFALRQRFIVDVDKPIR